MVDERPEGPGRWPYPLLHQSVAQFVRGFETHEERAKEAVRSCETLEKTLEDCRETRNDIIRQWHLESGMKPLSIARRLGLSKSTVHNILSAKAAHDDQDDQSTTA